MSDEVDEMNKQRFDRGRGTVRLRNKGSGMRKV